MALFLAFSLPLAVLIVIGIYFTKEMGNRRYLLHSLYGLLLSVPVLIINELVKAPLPKTFLFKDLFFNVLVFRTVQVFLFSLFVYHIPFGFRHVKREEKFKASVEWQTFLFFGTFYSAVSLVDAVLFFGNYNLTQLFIVPLYRLGIVFSTTVLLSFTDQETGIKKALLYAGTLATPLLCSIIFPMFYMKMYGIGIPLLLIVVGGSFAAFHIWMQRQYRPGADTQRIPLRAVK